MILVKIVCEGQTEERFVKDVLRPHFAKLEITLSPITVGRGNSYLKFKQILNLMLKSEPSCFVSTMIDLYGMNNEFPGYLGSRNLQPFSKVEAIEAAIFEDVTSKIEKPNRFIPYVQLHEFEALLFSNCEVLERALKMSDNFKLGAISRQIEKYESPEFVNDSVHTAPSKRIDLVAPSFNKVSDGVNIAMEIGLVTMREKCAHFNRWLIKLEKLA